ncbi:AGAP010170-PA-like protein [Anopheles sinensis]|uniref:AGAP010170-PA-like protein n=1 Tax=Anopheles sinensis TaxID=74873 RepID=A0A084VQ02_ANOSI|nr:AGAP010170-PA-like protein [Anopheles sinensis]
MKTGPFHGFPLLPAASKLCLLAQLTHKGIAQMLHVGDIIRQTYANALGLNTRVPISTLRTTPLNTSEGVTNPTPGSQYTIDDVVIYSTRYRRTFQSAMALLFGVLPAEKWLALQIQESHSLSYCFSDAGERPGKASRHRRDSTTRYQLLSTNFARRICSSGWPRPSELSSCDIFIFTCIFHYQ